VAGDEEELCHQHVEPGRGSQAALLLIVRCGRPGGSSGDAWISGEAEAGATPWDRAAAMSRRCWPFAWLRSGADGVEDEPPLAVEFSVARLRPAQAQELLRHRRPGAKSVAHAVDHIDAYLSACQLWITMASLGLGALGEPAFHDLLEPVLGDAATVAGFGLAGAVAFLIITTLHVVVGELAPKISAIAAQPRWCWRWRRRCGRSICRPSRWWTCSTRWAICC
jgi:cyclin M-like protein